MKMSHKEGGVYSYEPLRNSHSQNGPDYEHEFDYNSGHRPCRFPIINPKYRHLVSIPFIHLIRITVSLPLLSFIFNIFYVLIVDFERGTNTLCHDFRVIPNYLPSFSAVVGLFPLPRALWSIAVALHSAPRFLFIAMTYTYLDTIIVQESRHWAKVLFMLGVVENMGLIILTFVSSKANFNVHMWSFISFVLASEFYMLIYCTLLDKCRAFSPSQIELKSLRVKWKLTILNIVSAVLSAIVYWRHVNYCEPGVYSLFALLEYVVVLSNIGFHGSAYWDFYDRHLVI